MDKPGLAPRKLDAEVEIKVESDRFPAEPTVSENNPSVERPVEQAHVSDNTEATTKQTESNAQEAQPEQPLTNRAQDRIQTLANEKAQAEARAANAEAMLQRLVNVQVQQPVRSQEETLANQYKTFNPALGYPEDPKEYVNFVENRAALRAQQETLKQATQMREQQETADFVRAYPDAANDPIFLGAVAAQRAQAQRQGGYLSYRDAADIVSKELDKRATKKVAANVAQAESMKDEAYVESTRGASASSRVSETKPDIEKMSLEEKEAWLKAHDAW